MALPLRLASEATEVSMNYLISFFAAMVLAGLVATSATAEEVDADFSAAITSLTTRSVRCPGYDGDLPR